MPPLNYRVLYNASLHIGIGKWTYGIMVTPLVWKLEAKQYEMIDRPDSQMATLFIGPIMFSLTWEGEMPHWTKVLREVTQKAKSRMKLVRARARS